MIPTTVQYVGIQELWYRVMEKIEANFCHDYFISVGNLA